MVCEVCEHNLLAQQTFNMPSTELQCIRYRVNTKLALEQSKKSRSLRKLIAHTTLLNRIQLLVDNDIHGTGNGGPNYQSTITLCVEKLVAITLEQA